jgi:hypothetical protein
VIRLLFALLFNQFTIALRRRSGSQLRGKGPSSAAGAVVKVSNHTPKKPSCACLLREFLNSYHITTHDLADYGIPRRLGLDLRAGTVVPTAEQKLAIFNAAADKHARRQCSPRHFEYDDIFGPDARPRICSCEVRGLLAGASRNAVAAALGTSMLLADHLVLRWRAGSEAPSEEQLAILRKLAGGADIIPFTPAAQEVAQA